MHWSAEPNQDNMKKFLELLASRGIGDGRRREGHVLPQQKKKKNTNKKR